MNVLKFILWPILLICLGWVGIIFFGPSLISYAVGYFSEGRVNLTRVEVTPDLKINAAAVDFSLPYVGGVANLGGIFRAVSIDWKIENGFELIVAVGASSLKEHGTISSLDFRLKPASVTDWSEVDLQLYFGQLSGANFDLERGGLTGKFVNRFQDLDNVEFTLSKTEGKFGATSFEVAELVGTSDHYKFNQPLIKQDSKITYTFQTMKIPEGGFESSIAKGDLKLSNGQAVFQVLLADPQLTGQEFKAKSLMISSKRSLSTNSLEGAWEFSVSEIELISPAIKVKKYSGDLVFSPSSFLHTGKAYISNLDIKNDQYFIGKIEKGILDIDLSSRVVDARTEVVGRGVLTLKEVVDFSASGSIGFSLSEINVLECIFRQCELRSLEADYRIATADASLVGNLKCEKNDCLKRPTQHVLQTDNTNKFFQAISHVGILSPLSLPIAYLAISSGEIVGDGHILNF